MTDPTEDQVERDAVYDATAVATAFVRGDSEALDVLQEHVDAQNVAEVLAWLYVRELRMHWACHNDGQAPTVDELCGHLEQDRDQALVERKQGGMS